MHVVISPALSFQHHWRWFQCSMCRVIGARKLPWAGALSELKVVCEAEPKAIMRLRVCVSQKRSPNLLATVIWCWAVSNHILHTEPRVSIDLSTHDLDMPARPSHHTGWQHFCQSQSVSYKNSSRNSFVYTYTYAHHHHLIHQIRSFLALHHI